MSFDNRYPNRKDQRKPYYRGASIARSCRPGGDCPHCRGNRTHRNSKALLTAIEKAREYDKDKD